MIRRFRVSTSMLALLALPSILCTAAPTRAYATDEERLLPRFEGNVRAGSDRTIGMGEFWVPLTQGQDRVLYGDMRLSHDDIGNGEGDLGIGYRQIMDLPLDGGEAVVGVTGWIDRRASDLNSTFYQSVAGAEILARDFDIRANAYLPLTKEKEHITPNTGRTNAYMAGTGVFYDTTGVLTEEAQPGLDLEFGWRVPVFEDKIDNIRIYGGGFHFQGDKTENVTGWRARIAADITPAIAIGARFQKDDERGAMSFLEATVRFPFDHKKSFRKHGLKSRLDESPERDIDIVTNAKQTDTGLAKPVPVSDPAGAGVAQRVLHVDNTAAAGGDGSLEKPFNTLKAAEAALKDNDIVYVRRGDGTSNGQNLGFIINKANVLLAGSGSDLIYEGGRILVGNAANYHGTVIAAATAAPVITNITNDGNPATEDTHAIIIDKDKATVAGLSITGAQGGGIFANPTNVTWESIDIHNITTSGNTGPGIYLNSNGGTLGSKINNIFVKDVVTTNNGTYGLVFNTNVNGQLGEIGNIYSVNITANRNTNAGVMYQTPGAGGKIGTIYAEHISASENSSYGVYVRNASATGSIQSGTFRDINISKSGNNNGVITANIHGFYAPISGTVGNLELSGIQVTDNTGAGMQTTLNPGIVNSLSVSNLTATGNVGNGLAVTTAGGAASILNNLSLDTINANSNGAAGTGDGIKIVAQSTSRIESFTGTNLTANTNNQNGVYLQAASSGTINSATLTNVKTNSNGIHGLRFGGAAGTTINAVVDRAESKTNTQHGVYVFSSGATASTTNIVLKNSTVTQNVQSGVYLDHDSTVGASVFTANLGDGTTNSPGQNILTGNNTLVNASQADLRLDLNNSATPAPAQYNWWGQAGGPIAGQVRSDGGGNAGTATTTNPLAAAPVH